MDPTRPAPIAESDQPRVAEAIDRYWRQNISIMTSLLIVWAAAGLGCGVVAADWLNQLQLAGFPLGFWFAQQGSILIFILLILVYAILLNRLDDKYSKEVLRLRGSAFPPDPEAR